jgi:DNA/RNA-binding protein KIN17
MTKAEELMARETAAKKAREADAAAKAAEATAATPAAAAAIGDDRPPWLVPGLTVRLVAKALREAGLYRAKGVVASVDGYVATVDVVGDGGARVRVDQAHAETVLPGVGGTVRVVAGPRRGATGALAAIDEAGYRARVEALSDGGGDAWFEYDDVCKWRR